MKHVSERLQKDKRASNLDAPTGYEPFGRFHKRNPNPSPKGCRRRSACSKAASIHTSYCG